MTNTLLPSKPPKLPLRLRNPYGTSLRLGLAASCLLPLLILSVLFWLLVEDSGSLKTLIDNLTRDAEIFVILIAPVILVFTVGTLLTAAIAARSAINRPSLRIMRLLWTGVRTAWIVHGFAIVFQMLAILYYSRQIGADYDIRSREILEFFQLHFFLMLLVTTPLALICTYIFRMVAMTRKSAPLTETFD